MTQPNDKDRDGSPSDKQGEAKMLRTPWRWLPAEGNFIVDANGMIVAEVPCQGVENDKEIGAAIVRAVNASVAFPETGTIACPHEGACISPAQCKVSGCAVDNPTQPLTGDTPRTDAPACDFKHRLLCPRDAWQTARIEQLERHCAAWKLLAKQNEETAADALRQRDEARLAIEGMRGPLANAVALSAIGDSHPALQKETAPQWVSIELYNHVCAERDAARSTSGLRADPEHVVALAINGSLPEDTTRRVMAEAFPSTSGRSE